MSGANIPTTNKIITKEKIINAKETVKSIYFDDKVKDYVQILYQPLKQRI